MCGAREGRWRPCREVEPRGEELRRRRACVIVRESVMEKGQGAGLEERRGEHRAGGGGSSCGEAGVEQGASPGRSGIDGELGELVRAGRGAH